MIFSSISFEDFVALQNGDRDAAENYVLERVYHGEEL